MEVIKLKSRAKINLTLDVTGKREDGYHELEMIMQTLSIYDSIFIKKLEEPGVYLKCNIPYLPEDEKNIAYKAAAIMREKFHIKQGVYIELTKRIPVAAGLAGGSGNGAGVIKGMNLLFELGLSTEEMMEIGLKLGSDVPYCIMEGTALARGRGEVLTRIKPCPHFYVVLAKPQVGISTAFVYGNLKLDEIKCHPNTQRALKAIDNGDRETLCACLGNVLETVTIAHKPIIKEIKDYLAELGAQGVLMSGSGPTVFALFNNEENAEKAAEMVKLQFKINDVYVTETQGN